MRSGGGDLATEHIFVATTLHRTRDRSPGSNVFRPAGGRALCCGGCDRMRECLLCERNSLRGWRAEIGSLLTQLEPSQQSLTVRDLDSQSGTSVQLEHQRSEIAVEHDIDTDIAEACQLIAARR